MSSSPIHPSPAMIARSDTSISDCIRQMRDQGVGSVLVVSPDYHNQLVGIFTERDLLKSIDLIQHGGFWDKAVYTVMTKPVRTLNAAHLDQAAKTMLDHGFRHLPIVTVDENSKEILLGVISMRDILAAMLTHPAFMQEQKKAAAKAKIKTQLAAVSNDLNLLNLLKNGYAGNPQVEVRRIGFKTLLPPQGSLADVSKANAVLIDIDPMSNEEWTQLLRLLNTLTKPPLIGVVFDPKRHPPEIGKTLEVLGGTKDFAAFAKPINVFALFHRFKSALIPD